MIITQISSPTGTLTRRSHPAQRLEGCGEELAERDPGNDAERDHRVSQRSNTLMGAPAVRLAVTRSGRTSRYSPSASRTAEMSRARMSSRTARKLSSGSPCGSWNGRWIAFTAREDGAGLPGVVADGDDEVDRLIEHGVDVLRVQAICGQPREPQCLDRAIRHLGCGRVPARKHARGPRGRG